MLPPELLHQAFFLHALATEPARVLPPGKSLLAMMAQAPSARQPSDLHARVERVVHKVFWDQALQSLESPSPAVQLSRLKLLYNDLHEALTPLFPPQHPILLTLAAPLSPTSSPLHSTTVLLTDVLIALRQRCAPARDTDIDTLLATLASPLPPSETASVSDRPLENPLAVRVISTLRDLVSLADVLKRDLTNTLLGVMSEAQLARVIRQEAQTRERELVLDPLMWASVDKLKDLWGVWIGSESIWTSHLLRALTSPTPVTCQPEGSHLNSLPPQFFFSCPALLYIQNYLQALVISATLNALVRLPTPVYPGSPQDFMSRVWTLLRAEIDRDSHTTTADEQDDATKLVNLADEVIRARRLFSTLPISEKEERELRAAVERTLQLQDPVFALLQSRLVRAIDQRIIDHIGHGKQDLDNEKDQVAKIPEVLRTGRVHEMLRPSGSMSRCDTQVKRNQPAVVIKGFEDPVLVQAVEELVEKLLAVVQWVNSVWGDTTSSQ